MPATTAVGLFRGPCSPQENLTTDGPGNAPIREPFRADLLEEPGSEQKSAAVEDKLDARKRVKPSCSILFPDSSLCLNLDAVKPPSCVADLHMDQIAATIAATREGYGLGPYFWCPLASIEEVKYRHDVFRELESEELVSHIQAFAEGMRDIRRYRATAEKSHYKYERFRWILDAAEVYCAAVARLAERLASRELLSEGLRRFRSFLMDHVESRQFNVLVCDTRQLKNDLNNIKYRLLISGGRITATKYSIEPNYGADVTNTFQRFNKPSSTKYSFGIVRGPELDHVEASILDMVALLYPETFSVLERFSVQHGTFVDETIGLFDREIQFYLAYLEHIHRLRQGGLEFCYPQISDQSKGIAGKDTFDLALANSLLDEKGKTVPNDFCLGDRERIIVVSGPNQGGKTTFARTLGQLHYLAKLGCPVPGTEAKLFFCDQIFAHFEKKEDIHTLTGKLEEELLRIRTILDAATARSLMILNESFASTTPSDALYLSRNIMQRIVAFDLLCVSVTFLDELSTFSDTTISMVSAVDLEDPSTRTFKIVRRAADGRAYAMAIAKKYRLTSQSIKERIAANTARQRAS